MATFLDLSVLEGFRVVFTFLFIYVLIYATLQFIKPFGEIGKKGPTGMHAIIALTISVVSISYAPLRDIINFSVPWFFIVLFIAFFIIFFIKMFGAKDEDIRKVVIADQRVLMWIIVFVIVILIFGFGNAFGKQALQAGEWDGSTPQGTIEPDTQFIEDTGIGNANVDGTRVATNDYGTNVVNTVFNPKVLGLILVMFIGIFAILFLAK